MATLKLSGKIQRYTGTKQADGSTKVSVLIDDTWVSGITESLGAPGDMAVDIEVRAYGDDCRFSLGNGAKGFDEAIASAESAEAKAARRAAWAARQVPPAPPRKSMFFLQGPPQGLGWATDRVLGVFYPE